jgi:ribose-phosphate pyrophosphokinase
MSHLEPEAKNFCLFTKCLSGKKIAAQNSLWEVTTSHYSDGEFQPSYEESIRGLRVVYCLFYIPKFRQFDGMLMIDAAKRASARHITAVMPYFGIGQGIEKTNQGSDWS